MDGDEQINLQSLRYEGNICISGLTAAGKTTHAHLLAGELGLTYVSGSQIQLNFRGLSPIQTKDFWITEQAKALWNEGDFQRIDSELSRIEASSHGCVFDTSTMPWRRRNEGLCIWLESDLSSRVLKSIVSHRGRGEFSPTVYAERIAEKDRATVDLYRRLYGIEIGADMTPFDLIIDLSRLISTASLDASRASISAAHKIILAASAFYLTQREDFAAWYRNEVSACPEIVVKDNVAEKVRQIA